MTAQPQLLALILLVPLVGAGAVLALGRRPNWREAATLISAAVLFGLVFLCWRAFLGDGDRLRYVIAEPVAGLPLVLEAEPLGLLFALLASFLWYVTSVYSIGYMRAHGEANQTRFYACFALALSATMGIALAGNLLTLFLFYELLTLSTFPLVIHSGNAMAARAGRVYLAVLLGTSMGPFLMAMIWTWAVAGTLEFTPGGVLPPDVPAWLVALLLVLFVFGIGKAAMMPFHRWLPAAMVAPAPVSALLHAVAVVKAGVFTILKVTIYLFGAERVAASDASTWLAYGAAFTILAASLVALRKDNLKARLAYSTVGQLSYIVLGAMLANASGIIGGTMHMVMHAFGKITLFFCAGAIMVAAHKTEVSEMGGLGRRMPLTMGAFFVASLSIVGLPPLGGVWSKWHLVLGTLEADQLVLAGVLMLSSLLSIGYLLAVPLRAFFGEPPPGGAAVEGVREAPLPSLTALLLTATVSVLLFLLPEPLFQLARALVPGGAGGP